jgi:type IV pilus assembly protein PilM
MNVNTSAVLCRSVGVAHHSALARVFAPPSVLTAGGAGVDISDGSIKWLSLKPAERGWEIASCGARNLPEGVVVEGIVKDPEKLADALKEIKERTGIVRAHAALPEEHAYVLNMHIANIHDREQARNVVEFELEGRVPLKADQAVYDYDIIAMHEDGKGAEVGVTVFPMDIVSGYEHAFAASGIRLSSLELEARSIARAVMPPNVHEIVLLADFGRARTGIAIFKQQVPIFTSTVMVGGDTLTDLIQKNLSLTVDQAEEFKNENGLRRTEHEKLYELMMGTAAALSDEILRHYQYWDARRNEHGERVTPVARVLLAGGSSNLKGLEEYIAGRVQAPTSRVDVWQNVCSYDDYIPPVDVHHALGFATAIGLALRSV